MPTNQNFGLSGTVRNQCSVKMHNFESFASTATKKFETNFKLVLNLLASMSGLRWGKYPTVYSECRESRSLTLLKRLIREFAVNVKWQILEFFLLAESDYFGEEKQGVRSKV